MKLRRPQPGQVNTPGQRIAAIPSATSSALRIVISNRNQRYQLAIDAPWKPSLYISTPSPIGVSAWPGLEIGECSSVSQDGVLPARSRRERTACDQ